MSDDYSMSPSNFVRRESEGPVLVAPIVNLHDSINVWTNRKDKKDHPDRATEPSCTLRKDKKGPEYQAPGPWVADETIVFLIDLFGIPSLLSDE